MTMTIVLNEKKLAVFSRLWTCYTYCIRLWDSDSLMNLQMWSMAEYSIKNKLLFHFKPHQIVFTIIIN